MKGLLNFRLRLGQGRSNLADLFLLILLVLAFTTPQTGLAQTPTLQPCQEQTPTFTGIPEQTLCEQYPNFSCEIQIGAGTPYPKSSLLGSSVSGNVCMVGNFEVDASFTFQNALVKINPGVTISITPSLNGYGVGSSLGIDNSKLFACGGLWKGITLGQLSSISTWNNSVIEDAERAIYASGYCNLAIRQTTFNRDRIGIELYTPFPNIWVPGPVMWGFFGNQFTCTAPLNGTTNEITQVGIKLRNSDLFPFYGNTDNTFRGIIKGIVAESTGSTYLDQCNVYVNNYDFMSIRDKGIDFRGRSLDVRNSTFEGIAKHGIYFHESSFLNLVDNEFYIRELSIPMTFRYMVQVDAPQPDNSLNISNNYFYTEGQLFNYGEWGIQLTSSSFSLDPVATFNASVNGNTFDFYNASLEIPGHLSHAISIRGHLTADSDIDIEDNDFVINPFILNANDGIEVDYGDKHGIHIIGNRYIGGGTFVKIRGSSNSSGIEISDNTLNPANDFGIGVLMSDFPLATICSNTNNGASNVGYLLIGQNPGTVFSGNLTYGCWQHSFRIAGNQPLIGQQIHNGNEWGPAVVYNPSGPAGPGNYFVRPFLQHFDTDPDIVEMSQFQIHPPQSVWNGSQYTFFSPFHPATDEIVPDLNDEFFNQEPGTPTVSCLAQLQSPDGVDLLIANGDFAANITNQGSVFDAKRFLYKKLIENPTYQSAHPSFDAFLSAEQNSSVGKFYQLEKAIDDAHRLSAGDKATVDNLKTQHESLDQSLGQQGQSQSQLLGYIAQKKNLDSIAHIILTQHETNNAAVLGNALSLWQSITPQNVFEQYRKDVLGIYLTAQTQQGSILTEGQVEDLLDIAKLCSEVGGSAVYLAQGFLPECDRVAIMDLIELCHEVPEAGPRENTDARHILISEDAQVQVSPNPTRDWVNVVSVRQLEGRAEVYALTGQLVTARTIAFGDNPLRFDLPSGVYILRVTYANGDTSSHKLVINK